MNSSAIDAAGVVACAIALGLAGVRWLRVAQREHYLAGSAVRFARRWWASSRSNQVLWVIGAVGAVLSTWSSVAGFVAALAAGLGPLGLGLRGRTSKLNWTGRLRRLALLSTVIAVVATGAAIGAGAGAGALLHGAFSALAICALGAPVIVDLGMLLAKPLEGRLLQPFLVKAQRRLAAVSPRVVAITGSFGKTTTKGYIAHLTGGHLSVVATPASFNNSAGLARAVNEHLSTGTQLFVAEMGTYGPGEIRAMCEWAVPEVAIITAIGPVHLERMGSLERIAEAKAEILERAKIVVLNVDYPLLADLAAKAEDDGKVVWRCSSRGLSADVLAKVEGPELHVQVSHFTAEMEARAPISPGVEPGNVACAVAAALCIGVPPQIVAGRLGSLPSAPHRRNPQRASNGADVIDDTYNANPEGAVAALALLGGLGVPGGKKVIVTPGMVELGRWQARENSNFAARSSEFATEIGVVGRTNAKALLAGAKAGGLPARQWKHRAAAVAWVSRNLGPGDAVLYENDLPDHYP